MNDEDRFHHEWQSQLEEIEADAEYGAWLDRINEEMREATNEQQG